MATYKSTMRSINASINRAQREAARRQRELEQQRKQAAKLQAAEQARIEVALFENWINLLTSLHHDVGPRLDWAQIADSPPPMPDTGQGDAAQRKLDDFSPSRLFKARSEQRRLELESAVLDARAIDAARHQEAREHHTAMQTLAQGVLIGEEDAYEAVISELLDTAEVSELGEHLSYRMHDASRAEVTLNAHSDDIIPTETKSRLQSGKLSTKKMPVSKRWELYQDHICSASLRVAADLFNALPLEMVIVTVVDELLNTSTGYKEVQPILSVAVARATLEELNLRAIDPSDAMSNFVHRMDFRKTKGFAPVIAIDPSDLSEP